MGQRQTNQNSRLKIVATAGLVTALLIMAMSQTPNANAQNRGLGPLGKIIQRILVPQAVDRDDEPDEARKERGSRDRDHIDSRAPQDQKLQSAYRAALEGIEKQQDWATAMDVLQRVLDHDNDSLERNQDGTWTSLKWLATQTLLRAPENVRRTYIERYAPLAEALRKEARQTSDRTRLTSVATRFMLTPAGQLAADELALGSLDRGEYGLASRWHEMLWLAQAEFVKNPPWQLRAALTAKYAGRKEFLETLTKSWPEWKQGAILASGEIRQPLQWLDRMHTIIEPPPQSLTEQWIPQGLGGRVSASKTSDYVLLPLYAHPISTSSYLLERIRTMTEELLESGRIPLLTNQPLVVGDRLIVRDLGGVQVYDIRTGRSLWQTEMTVVPENVFLDSPAANGTLPFRGNVRINRAAGIRMARNGMVTDSSMDENGDSADYHPLGTLLFREGTYNSLSSDGQRLFVVEDQAVITRANPAIRSMDGNIQDPLGQNWRSNRLTAYDLTSGRILWTIGGGGAQDSLGLPLAGGYFHSAPLPDRDELLVTCEIAGEVRLVALNPQSGSMQWSQLIGYPDSKIEDDIARRWINNSVATSQGIIICPTTLGWLVAVDRERHSILWAQRYSEIHEARGMSHQGAELLGMQSLGSEWHGSIPSIMGDAVVYAPAESQHLFCFDLLSGRQRWKMDRGNHVFVAAVTPTAVVLAHPRGLTALNLADGQSFWTTELPESDLLAGRGVLGNGEYLAPSRQGRIYSINLQDGGITGTRRTANDSAYLGNLVAAGDRLVSFSTDGLVTYTSRPQLARWLKNTQENAPQMHSLRAQLALVERRPREARQALDEAFQTLDAAWILQALPPDAIKTDRTSTSPSKSEPLSPDDSTYPLTPESFRRIVWTVSLTRLHEGNFDQIDLDRLSRAASTTAEKGLAIAHSLRARSRQTPDIKFFNELTAFVESFGNNTFPDDQNSSIRLTGKAWARGLLREMTLPRQKDSSTLKSSSEKIASADEQPAVASAWSELLRKQLASSAPDSKQEPSDQKTPAQEIAGRNFQLLLELADFHPVTQNLKLAAIDQLIENKLLAEAELKLLLWKSSSLETQQSLLDERLAKITALLNAEQDLAALKRSETQVSQAPASQPGTPAPATLPVAQGEATTTPANGDQVVASAPNPPAPWGMETMGATYSQQMQTGTLSSNLPSISAYRYDVDHQAQKIAFRHRSNPAWNWRPSLAGSRNRGNQHTVALTVGHSVYVLHQQVLTLLSPLEKKSIWSYSLEETGPNARSGHRPSPMGLIDTENNMISLLASEQLNARGRFAGASPGGLVLFGKRTLDVFDPVTGDLRWQKINMRADSRVIVLNDYLLIYSFERSQMAVHRLDDGREISTPWESQRLHQAIGTTGNSLILFDRNTKRSILGLVSGNCTIRKESPITGKVEWSLGLPAGTAVSEIMEGTWFVSKPSGETLLLSAETGTSQSLGAIPLSARGTHRGEKFVSTDGERIYLFLNDNRYSDARFADSLSSHRASGEIFTWNLATGKLLWNCKIANQQLAMDSLADAPVLVFASRSWKQKADVHYSMLWMDVIDKATGTSLFSQSRPFASSGLHSFSVTPDGQKVELATYNMKLRLGPVHAPSTKSADSNPDATPKADSAATPAEPAKPSSRPEGST